MRTLLIIKPDAYEMGLEKRILGRFTSAGLRIARSEKRKLSPGEVDELYREHRGKPFFEPNRNFILSGAVGLFVLSDGDNVVARVRKIVGGKVPGRAGKGTIRGDFGIHPVHVERNLVHASSSPRDAEREIALLIRDKGSGRPSSSGS
jgi:nucleoside-diphosphate kinase